jgi:ABC-type dipeptide/oligopeptide/nickel transport system permease component
VDTLSHYILRRLLLTLPVIFGVSVFVFLILHMSPGDPALMIAGADAPPETIKAVRQDLGLDRPLYQQYATYLGRVLQGDLGRSVRSKEPVTKLIANTFPKTATLALVALVVGIMIALPAGIISAVRRSSWVDTLTRFAAFMGVSMPVFAVGLLLMWLFAYKWRLLPLSGYGGPIWTVKGLRSVILPALTSASFSIAVLVRITRSSMLDVIGQDFIRTARAKGLGERSVIYKHALRNALLPVITVLGVQFGGLMGGAVVTETIFAWPGMGRLALNAILSRDFPVVQGVVLLVALMFVTVNLLVDLVYGFVDPRIQYD